MVCSGKPEIDDCYCITGKQAVIHLISIKILTEKSLNTDEALELSFLLSSDDLFLFSSSAICSSIFRMVSISSLSVLSSSSVNESLFDSTVPQDNQHNCRLDRRYFCSSCQMPCSKHQRDLQKLIFLLI